MPEGSLSKKKARRVRAKQGSTTMTVGEMCFMRISKLQTSFIISNNKLQFVWSNFSAASKLRESLDTKAVLFKRTEKT